MFGKKVKNGGREWEKDREKSWVDRMWGGIVGTAGGISLRVEVEP